MKNFTSFKLYLENSDLKNEPLSVVKSEVLKALGPLKSNLEIRAYGKAYDVYHNQAIDIVLKVKVPAPQSDLIKSKLEKILGVAIKTSYGFGPKEKTPFHWLSASFTNKSSREVYSYLVHYFTQLAEPYMTKDAKYFLDQGINLDEFGMQELGSLAYRATTVIVGTLQIDIGNKDVQALSDSVVNQFMDYTDETGVYRGPIIAT